ncbi:hypothetical protein [Amycolatopsis sp. RTGN1]|uniref:hypothetical protein n=1 Tax=Amycolatopsis ponsaeliensis TaxID=2992142 RepID=UPI00254E147F|nr:hypothetical protein [Amycolatopsis sp. RTGN1]
MTLSSDQERALGRLRELRRLAPDPAPTAYFSLWGELAQERRRAEIDQAERLARNGLGFGDQIVSGEERVQLASWLAAMTGWWTTQEPLATLDDLVAELPADEVVRICGEEGLALIGEREHHGDRQLFLVDEGGLLAELFLERSLPGNPEPWSLTIYGNVEIVDPVLLVLAARTWSWTTESDGRRLAAGSRGWHLRNSIATGGSLRAALAAMRASTRPVLPWKIPPITGWLGPDSPRGLEKQPHEKIALAARADTRAALDTLPEYVRAKLGPCLMTA